MSRSLRTRIGVLLAAALLAPSAVLGAGGPALAATAAEGGSAVTLAAPAPFDGLSVTVSQTANLVNQVVQVSWTGGTPTTPSSSRFSLDYLHVMQCWGDAATGPRREQCQYGGRLGDDRGGAYSATRQVTYGPTLVDPLETYTVPEGSFDNAYVPFESVTGATSTGSRSEFFDASTTNEIPYARTRSDGGGVEQFEVQTALEAPGLGCGARLDDGGVRSCWLVVVPRSDLEVDGTERIGSGAFQLESSPLSASNWQHRLAFGLDFEPLASTCPQQSERRLVGQETVAELVTRWQPALCADGGATYGFSQVTDDLARRQLVSEEPGMVVVSEPVAPADVPAERPVVYGPVALSGVALSFLVERQVLPGATEEELRRDGTVVEDLRLTPRLVAKLLTQSYSNAAAAGSPGVKDNPGVLSADPEFLALNPEFAQLIYTTLSDALVPAGQSDAARLLWRWVDADPEARAWLDGAPDEHGMVVNPAYAGIELPVADFPKNDTHCQAFDDGRSPLCSLERRPYAADLHEAARAAARGDSLARTTWDPFANPPSWRRSAPQPNGSRAVLAVTDTATAARYGLRTASLRNAAGEFVRPGEAGLLAGAAAMTPSPADGVLVPDVTSTASGAYPLTTFAYAATAPAALSQEEGVEYAAFLDYAAEDGQSPGVAAGTLPAGYVPLPQAQRAQATDAAARVRAEAGVPVAGAPVPDGPAPAPPSAPTASRPDGGSFRSSGSSASSGAGGFAGALTDAGVATGLDAPLPSAPAATALPAAPPVALAGLTPADALGGGRYALPLALLLGVIAALAAPALTRRRPPYRSTARPAGRPASRLSTHKDTVT